MGQKVNPISLRLQKTNREFDNSWYSSYFYRKLVCRDIYIQQYINSFLKLVKFPSARFSIQYSTKNIKLYSFLCFPLQSRQYRSRMFGINFPKKKTKTFFQHSHSFLQSKKNQQTSVSFYNVKKSVLKSKKSLKFIGNSFLWSRVSNPFNSLLLCKKEPSNFNTSNIDTKLVTKKRIKINQHSKNSKYYSLEYRKNFIKYFLVFSSLYLEYNRNILDNIQDNKIKQHLLNSLFIFSTFQPISIFYTTLQKNTPIFYLLQNKTSVFSNLKKDPNLVFFQQSSKKNTLKKNQVKMHDPYQLKILPNRDNTFLSSYFSRVKKDQMQKIKYKNYIQNFLHSQFNINTEFKPLHVSQDWQSAGFLADEIVYFLERRVTFRRLKNKIIKKVMENPSIRGIRINCSGRVGGKSKKAQRAKTESVKAGQTSRNTFSSKIDFAARTARTIFGSVGIKVWICYK